MATKSTKPAAKSKAKAKTKPAPRAKAKPVAKKIAAPKAAVAKPARLGTVSSSASEASMRSSLRDLRSRLV